jgi:hypothetical protein
VPRVVVSEFEGERVEEGVDEDVAVSTPFVLASGVGIGG